MTYSESAENVTISRARALAELTAHGVPACEYAEFFADLGNRESYNAGDVLRWLGY